ncbi:MAG: hypothetical protein KY475_22100 [Planctomycetes bacterium]|nr:hypothetical protein [Planctomycetota bacterium]
MRFSRLWPMSAALVVGGLMYVMLARAESKPPQPPQPDPIAIDVQPAEEEAQSSPSDLPRLEREELFVWPTTKACPSGECPPAGAPVFTPFCPPCTSVTITRTCPNGACEVACRTNAPCGDTACGAWKAKTVAACQTADECACPKTCACGENCPCGAAGHAIAPVWSEGPADYLGYHPHPALPPWGPVPPGPRLHLTPPPFMGPPQEPPHAQMHQQLVEAMMENARLSARDEAWGELQRRNEETTKLAVENAQLKARIEVSEVLAQSAALTARLEAVQERQELLESVMEVVSENAKLETTVAAMERQLEMHSEMVGGILQAKEELLEPLHEALVENAALKAAAEATEETAALKARVAELEHALSKLAQGKDHKIAPAVKTAKTPETASASETK